MFPEIAHIEHGARPDPTDKKSRALIDYCKGSPNDMKRFKFLHVVPLMKP